MVATPEARVVTRLRVLHAIQNLNYGGMERLFADLVRRLDPERFESHVLVLGYFGRFAEGLEAHATLHRAAAMTRGSLLYPRALARQIREIAPDVVHSHAGVWYKVSLASRHARVPRFIQTEHGRELPDPWLARRLGWLASRRTDVVVAVSDALAAHLRAQVVAHPDRLTVILNGVDTAVRAPRPDNGVLRASLNLAPEVPIIGSVGRLEPIKGYDLMIEAFARLVSRWGEGPPPALVVAGDGSERERLERRVGELGLGGRVFLLGWREDVDDLYRAFTCFAMTSRSEGTSVSLLEAMSSGLCPVVTPVGGNPGVLGAGLAQCLTPSLDPGAIAVAWLDLLRDPERRARDAAGARARVAGHFSLEAMTRAYEELYRSVR